MGITKELGKILNSEKIYYFSEKLKYKILKKYLNQLTLHHFKKNKEFKNICEKFLYNPKKKYEISSLPFIPVSLFKSMELSSVSKKKIIKTMYSSGTSGQARSKIFLDKNNSINQMKALNKIFFDLVNIQKKRVPLIIIDQNIYKNYEKIFSARAAAYAGFSIFSLERIFVLNKDMSINLNAIKAFLEKYKNEKKIILGLTSIIWENFINNKELKNSNLNFDNCFLIHGGGWKKLEKKKVSGKFFKKKIKNILKIENIFNYYGMIEQAGSIFFECKKCNNFITSIYSDIIIRDKFFNDVGFNKKGMVQLISVLPTSYPGHNILTEDIGMIVKNNNCDCEKKGKRFKIFGRLKKSEIRGCGNAII